MDWVLYDSFFKDKLKDESDKTLKNLKDYIKYIKQQYTAKEKNEKIPQSGANECLKNEYVEELQTDRQTENSITFKRWIVQ